MKKTLVSALAGAMVAGVAATTFAAANPFSDVSADHWAYDAVTQLAADGVIEGYGDGTFRGDRNITRYEMAQMIAKAMARTDVSAADRALIDKLAAEFSEELNNLGVRVANLEKYADKVVWHGKMEYTYTSTRYYDRENIFGEKIGRRENSNGFVFRLEPKAEINKHWNAHARIDGHFNTKTDQPDNFTMSRGWAQGNYKNFTAKLGRFELCPAGEHGIVWDTDMSGAMLTFGDKFKVNLLAGRVDANSVEGLPNTDTFLGQANFLNDAVSSVQGINLQYDEGGNKGFSGGIGYYRVINDNFSILKSKNHTLIGEYALGLRNIDSVAANWDNENKANIWTVNAGYKFSPKANLWASYAHNTNSDYQKNSWQAQFTYGDYADAKKAGSWNVYVAYRKFGYGATLAGTVYDDVAIGTKGFAIGAAYAPMKNVGLLVKYFKGKLIDGNGDASRLFGRVEMFF